jgi:hypothetical protein
MNATIRPTEVAGERAAWKAVALPSEHGGWGLTLEPVLLGLIVAWSIAGLALAIAAFGAFVVRTPLKLVSVDLRRHRWLPRSALALRFTLIELVVIIGAVAVAVAQAGLGWLVPVLIALPFVAVEMWFDIRSRGRRLLPELCGAVGICAVAASIAIADGRSARLAVGLWLVLAARAVAAIPFVRVQIMRLRRGTGSTSSSDVAQAVGLAVAAAALLVDDRLLVGALAIVALAIVQSLWVRRDPIPAKRLGLRQMAMGLGLVAVTAVGVLL